MNCTTENSHLIFENYFLILNYYILQKLKKNEKIFFLFKVFIFSRNLTKKINLDISEKMMRNMSKLNFI